MTQLSRASGTRRDWAEHETARLQEVFGEVWEQVGPKVAYEITLSEVTPRVVVFTVDETHRLFVRPETAVQRRRTIQGMTRTEQNAFGIYVEYKAGGRALPAHLDEYLQCTIIGVGEAAQKIAVLPAKICAEMAVETWQYSKMPSSGPIQDGFGAV